MKSCTRAKRAQALRRRFCAPAPLSHSHDTPRVQEWGVRELDSDRPRLARLRNSTLQQATARYVGKRWCSGRCVTVRSGRFSFLLRPCAAAGSSPFYAPLLFPPSSSPCAPRSSPVARLGAASILKCSVARLLFFVFFFLCDYGGAQCYVPAGVS